jgi:two-component system nitrogen regulation sensor histidine kinase NtrY
MVPAALAVLAGAGWLRTPAEPYLVVCALATGASMLLALRAGDRRWTPLTVLVVMLGFSALAFGAQRGLSRVDRDWNDYRATLEFTSADALQRELLTEARALQAAAARALEVAGDTLGSFDAVNALVRGQAERGVVVYHAGRPIAWAGKVRVPTRQLEAPLGAIFSSFYLTLYATATRGTDRAVATALVHAEPPADRISRPLDVHVATETGVRGFQYGSPADAQPGFMLFASRRDTLFAARPAPVTQGEERLRLLERAQVRGGALLAAAVLTMLVAAWRRPATLAQRLAALATTLAVVAIVPLSAFSNTTVLFSALVYYAALGGPLTGSVGALAISSALLLVGLLAVLRARIRVRSRWPAAFVVLLVAGLGPFLMRDLARGINPRPWGISLSLWLAWEVALFFAGVVVLLAGVSAGRALLGARRGLPPFVAPLLAGIAALLGPVLWEAPGRWPGWYPVLWIAAMLGLTLTRRSRVFLLNAAVVAALGSVTLVWGTAVRKRAELAERDATGLNAPDPNAFALLERMGRDLARGELTGDRAEMLRYYVRSDLDDAGYPVELTSWRWTPDNGVVPTAALVLSEFRQPLGDVARLVDDAWRTRLPLIREVPGEAGLQLVLAVPRGDVITSVTVAPRTRLIRDDPFTALLGVAPEAATEAPYTLTLASDARAPLDSGAGRWRRKGDELHGDWIIAAARGPTRVHVEVELRSPLALLQRGSLIVLFDLVLILFLWAASAAADGGLARWARTRVRHWARSYRARLTFALFAFFVVPAVVFAVWSYKRLQSDDQQSRELTVRETLRTLAASGGLDSLGAEGQRLGAPLFVYADGELRETSDSLYDELAPIGRFLPPPVARQVLMADEVTASFPERVGLTPTLVGYRAATTGPGRTRIVLASPARTDELALDRQRRDLGILVLFTTAIGGLAALWLSGMAARELAKPIGTLRSAAQAIARGDREPALIEVPPAEFEDVFSAFRRMARDLALSRTALESARRRTEAVLRNVASGVIATDEQGKVTLANPRAEALVQQPLVPGAPLSALELGELPGRVAQFGRDQGDEEEFDLELHGRQLHGRLTRLTSGEGGAVLTLDDVTELVRAQRVLAWGEMARQVAHEIKNPLTPIRLGVQHLKRAYGDARVDFNRVLDQNVGRILAEIDRLDEIARAFSRYGTAPAEQSPGEMTDVAAIVRDVVELERMGESELRWRVDGAQEPVLAVAQGDELREVLLNVLENARLAHARCVSVAVQHNDGRVEIHVDDDGDGIPAEVLPRIFEPHFSTRTSGSGLGLAISRRLVDGWGGEISVESTRGTGAHVTIALATGRDSDHR